MVKFLPYCRQFIDGDDKGLVFKALSNDFITTGPFVEKFENQLKKYLLLNLRKMFPVIITE